MYMSRWCDTCHRNDITGLWQSCSSDCPVFGKDFGTLQRAVLFRIFMTNDKKEEKQNESFRVH